MGYVLLICFAALCAGVAYLLVRGRCSDTSILPAVAVNGVGALYVLTQHTWGAGYILALCVAGGIGASVAKAIADEPHWTMEDYGLLLTYPTFGGLPVMLVALAAEWLSPGLLRL